MRRLTCVIVALALITCDSQERHDSGAPDPLVPLTTFLAPKSFDAPQISPDGTKIAYLGPVDGTSNFFVAPVDNIAAARAVTNEVGRGVRARDVSGVVMYRWTADSRYLLYPQDHLGDESWNLFRVDTRTGETVDLTRLEGSRVELVALSRSDPHQAMVAISDSLVEPADLYRLDISTGERVLVEKNPGFLGYLVDHDLHARIAMALDAEGDIDVLTRSAGGQWQPAFTVGQDDFPALSATGYQKIARFDASNRRAFFYDSRGRDTIALAALTLDTNSLEIVAADERVDIAGVLYHPTESVPQAYATNWTRTRWHALDQAVRDDLDFLDDSTEGDFRVVSRSADDRLWIVRFTLAHEPESYSLYERREKVLTKLFDTTPQLVGLRLSKLYPEVIRSRDGLELVSYLSYPPWITVDDNGRPAKPVPLVMLVHGGPGDERAQYAYGPFLHWLNNRGYGVFYVNFRGSPGFGKAFVNAARMEWGGKMHDDLVDQVEWAIAEGITTRDKVAILGGSYGGYAVLVGMTMTPDVFACGIDMVGPSNLEIFMPHWDVDMMSRVIGDPRTEEGRELLRSRSPIRFAHQAKHPILIAQGANDARVPQDQSDSMVEMFAENGVEVTYVLYPDEGHGLQRAENTFSFWAIAEGFLARCLGGRSQPITDELEGSSAQILVGAEHIPGLVEALTRRDAG